MKTRLVVLLALLTAALPAAADILSLSHVFLLGRTLKDTDGDKLPDKIGLWVVLPDSPGAAELAAAADIAARANFDCLAQDFEILKRESEAGRIDRLDNVILLGTNVKWLRDALKDGDIEAPALGPNQGFVSVFASKAQTGLFVIASSEDALLQTARAFFLRWPYLWDIWGREEGHTYASLERDIEQLLAGDGIVLQRTVIKSVQYEFPPDLRGATAGKLAFRAGEVKNLTAEIFLTDEDELNRAGRAFEGLRQSHLRGQKTELLSYPGCAKVTVRLLFGKTAVEAVLPRTGLPKRMLTPVFKDVPRPDSSGRDFDLTGLFGLKGLYTDGDHDGLPDGLDSRIVIPSQTPPHGVVSLASRLVLGTAGATFPLVAIDKEIEHRQSLVAPILVGANALTQELIRIGKLAPPPLEPGTGWASVVPAAFNKSTALAVLGGDGIGLDKTLEYLGRTFPYFEAFGPGRPQVGDVPRDIDGFLKGGRGAAESHLLPALAKALDDLKDRPLESLRAEISLPKPNPRFEEEVKRMLAALKPASSEINLAPLTQGRRVFEKEKAFDWEGERAVEAVRAGLKGAADDTAPIKISLGVSESPDIRQRLKQRIETLCREEFQRTAEVEVLSAYKQGFFWLTERVAPALKGKGATQVVVRFAKIEEDFRRPKRFYAEPSRWLQELYPADEILARELGLPIDKIRFEINPDPTAVYDVTALDAKNAVLFEQGFSPRTKTQPYLRPVPEWGDVTLTTGWVRLEQAGRVLADAPLASDLEEIWSYYQDEVLAPVQAQILRQTGQAPTFSKQPFFKQLKIEIWASEPDFRLGLDEEMVSSLESLHDEIYFDTLDFLRGMIDLDGGETDLPEDTQRISAPGNVLPIIHGSTEGEAPRIKVVFEDWPDETPRINLKWRETGREEASRRIAFPALAAKPVRIPWLLYNGLEERVGELAVDLEFERESDYLALVDLLGSYRDLAGKGMLADPMAYPRLDALRLRLKCGRLSKEESLPVAPPDAAVAAPPPPAKPGQPIIDTTRVLSPEMVEAAIRKLSGLPALRTWIGGRSYEGRAVPVIEAYRPLGTYVSIPRLVALKPTLFLNGRQHANEVSSTTYILKLAELLARDPATSEYLSRINFVLQPMENPDGAALAAELQSLTPFHSLHAGRYGTLGLDVGSPAGSRPVLPEASVRRDLAAKWAPDIALNLHGYPSHEWVQAFSDYSPYLFRDYWIPKGWFAYVRGLSLPLYDRYKEAGDDLRGFITAEMNADPRIKESNRKFYERYARWATRWQPFASPLETYEGVALFAKRRSGAENRLTARGQVTYAEGTPELMDETASGAWLDFLSGQGLAFIRAHLKYLSLARFETARIEEEVGDRVRIQLVRGRPGLVRLPGKN
ncbi:MAG: M14 family metallopeptidase [Candidatus Aminicenantes bacterium]|nr:M14 family metallopeptidase [Candidatus Aminicenantes bacterium]